MGTISNLVRRFSGGGGGRSRSAGPTSHSGGGGGLGRILSGVLGRGRRH